VGLEVAVALAIAGAIQTINQGKSNARGIAHQGRIEAEKTATRTKARAAQQKSSFLASGVTLEGTPMAALDSTFTMGIADTNQVIANANRSSRNVLGRAYSTAFKDLAMTGATVGMAGGFGASTGAGTSTGGSFVTGSSSGASPASYGGS